MRLSLALAVAGTGFLLFVVAIRDQAALVRAGYQSSELETTRQGLAAESARARARVSRLGSPLRLIERARELGLETEYPRGFLVVRMGSGREAVKPVVVQNR